MRTLETETCYRALTARDRRFDGLFFVGVSTTGIYCRPVCTARTPRQERCAFYRTAAEAEHAGFRACLLCRPELAPGSAPVDSVPRLVAAAVARIEGGYLNESSLEDLAAELGVTSRHLRRAMEAELGVSPVELAQSRRLALAKQLLQDTALPLAEVAFASGFQSVRRFNALFQERFGRPPSELRRASDEGVGARALVLRLDYRPPLDWEQLLRFLRGRAIPGVEHAGEAEYRRTVRLGGRTGWLSVRKDPKRPALLAEVSLSLAGVLMQVAARLRSLFDLDAQPEVIAECLGRDALLAKHVQAHPGLRVLGAFEPFELAVRAILGQQVTVRAATTLSGRLVARFGEPVDSPHAEVSRLFPLPETLAAASEDDVAALGMPGARARSLLAVARAVAEGSVRLERHAEVDETMAALEALPGIGAWTAHYVAMRALRWPDAFPASDLGIRKALGGVTAKEAGARAEAWRPWRSYAAIHLWTSLSEGAGG
ncbi:DNA-3-methyladenine glycosylase II [Archangium gephyra]|uniref:DNA-3-methyladenine glycosylase II n=1 Tax=Archangium gephyra TaxID=48 RepID=A0AAC8Q682_9BACT|nr:DNA-3-methyladenine glycosylase 2 [Archangium gephyra]AKJ01848.1 ADA regulatory protein [Archangium gephyra]REG34655.1 DNA-3-methyladenine glycosylase II [Archangium gephyra]